MPVFAEAGAAVPPCPCRGWLVAGPGAIDTGLVFSTDILPE
ncbi:hypothetical protein BN2364_1646 [Alloalcanivorax xenomutans]|nr:hypothetical protein BN2364_1646 [Alloalcanivorax xenomutans]